MNDSKRKHLLKTLENLTKLADDQRGKPEGEAARNKIVELINKYPALIESEPVIDLATKDLKMMDLFTLKKRGGSLAGSWTGRDFQEAYNQMVEDYRQRIDIAEREAFLKGNDYEQ